MRPISQKCVRGAREIDDKMADARKKLDWEAQWACAIDPEIAKAIRDDRKPEHDDTCSMVRKVLCSAEYE